MDQSARPPERPKKDAFNPDTLAGRASYWAIFVGYGFIELSQFILAMKLSSNKQDGEVYQIILRSIVFFLIWLAAYTGSSRARKLLGALFAVGLFLSLPMFYKPALPGFMSIFLVSMTCFGLFCVWSMWFSPQVKRYEKAVRRQVRRTI
ncbi:hypothetical protein AYO49_03275 [Verrucomicrobiaceae bacterium SCGC AG-212-N21]|nr:hypothetical protein AYO49_03275 [Verrucomicrobiaceae bacterium SCGC AG-212-N21]